jgi:hypothetical protein
MALRVSESIKIGPFRIRLTASKRGLRAGASTRVGPVRVGVSEPIGKRQRRR